MTWTGPLKGFEMLNSTIQIVRRPNLPVPWFQYDKNTLLVRAAEYDLFTTCLAFDAWMVRVERELADRTKRRKECKALEERYRQMEHWEKHGSAR